MSEFVVSARKYRPQTFSDVVGQEHITTTLQNAIASKQMGHALLFCGPRGVGKTTCARIVAKQLNTTKEPTHQNFDFNIFELDAASNNKVEDIRNLIDQVRYPPQVGEYKVYIIDEVHMLSNQAFNAFLKTLEEPPPYAVFILATTEKHKVIPTILSRCQIYDFKRIEIEDTVKQLTKVATAEEKTIEPSAARIIAQKSDGAMRDALSMFDLIGTFVEGNHISYEATINNLHILDYDYYFKMVDALYYSNLSDSLILFDEIIKKGFDGGIFLNGVQEHLRSLLVTKESTTEFLLESSEDLKKRYKEQSLLCDTSFLLSGLSIASQFELTYKSSRNQRLHVELCLMKIAHLPFLLELSSPESSKKKTILKNEILPKPPHKQEVEKVSIQKEEPVAPNPSVTPLAVPTPEDLPKKTILKNDILSKPPHKQEVEKVSIQKEEPVAPNPSVTPLAVTAQDLPKKTERKLKVDSEALETLSISLDSIKKEEEPLPPPSESNDFTTEALQQTWKRFFEQNQSKLGVMERSVLKYPLEKLSQEDLNIVVHSSLEEGALNGMKIEILNFLRKALGVITLRLKVEIVEKTTEDREPYTDREILDEMMKKNPELKQMIQKFQLGITY